MLKLVDLLDFELLFPFRLVQLVIFPLNDLLLSSKLFFEGAELSFGGDVGIGRVFLELGEEISQFAQFIVFGPVVLLQFLD